MAQQTFIGQDILAWEEEQRLKLVGDNFLRKEEIRSRVPKEDCSELWEEIQRTGGLLVDEIAMKQKAAKDAKIAKKVRSWQDHEQAESTVTLKKSAISEKTYVAYKKLGQAVKMFTPNKPKEEQHNGSPSRQAQLQAPKQNQLPYPQQDSDPHGSPFQPRASSTALNPEQPSPRLDDVVHYRAESSHRPTQGVQDIGEPVPQQTSSAQHPPAHQNFQPSHRQRSLAELYQTSYPRPQQARPAKSNGLLNANLTPLRGRVQSKQPLKPVDGSTLLQQEMQSVRQTQALELERRLQQLQNQAFGIQRDSGTSGMPAHFPSYPSRGSGQDQHRPQIHGPQPPSFSQKNILAGAVASDRERHRPPRQTQHQRSTVLTPEEISRKRRQFLLAAQQALSHPEVRNLRQEDDPKEEEEESLAKGVGGRTLPRNIGVSGEDENPSKLKIENLEMERLTQNTDPLRLGTPLLSKEAAPPSAQNKNLAPKPFCRGVVPSKSLGNVRNDCKEASRKEKIRRETLPTSHSVHASKSTTFQDRREISNGVQSTRGLGLPRQSKTRTITIHGHILGLRNLAF